LFLLNDGTVSSFQKVSSESGGFDGVLTDSGGFGYSITSLGDLNADGNIDIAVGAPFTNDTGIVWTLFLNADGTVGHSLAISSTVGGFDGTLTFMDSFGSSLSAWDVDNDGLVDLVVGADGDSDRTGAVWVLQLKPEGAPTELPTGAPTRAPTAVPTLRPTEGPTLAPTETPSPATDAILGVVESLVIGFGGAVLLSVGAYTLVQRSRRNNKDAAKRDSMTNSSTSVSGSSSRSTVSRFFSWDWNASSSTDTSSYTTKNPGFHSIDHIQSVGVVKAGQISDDDFVIKIKDLQLGKAIARGGYGVVYKGTYSKRECAVKEIPLETEVSSKELDLLRRETTLLAKLRHPNLVGTVLSS
jgi:hypothetical protein